ncbi:hypothetical protein LZ30DRAFT_194449 [Colletotrichum cereale]|nr:hypothetical protein LZ30DRAFT_194449 [Colletotrichum cereale]
MDESDVLSLWETKKDADILLTMGVNKWQLHENIIRGKSGLVDHILDIASVQNEIRKIALKEHAFTASALEATLKYFYLGDGVLDGKTEVIELLAVYDVSATFAVSALQQLIAPRIGNLLGDILTSRIHLIDDFMIAADVIVSEEAETWATMRQELQEAIHPHIGMLFSQQEFTNLLKTNQVFCFETLSAAVARMHIIEQGAEESSDRRDQREDGDGVESGSGPTRVSCLDVATQTDVTLDAISKGFDFTFAANDTDDAATQHDTTPKPVKAKTLSRSNKEADNSAIHPVLSMGTVSGALSNVAPDATFGSSFGNNKKPDVPQSHGLTFEGKKHITQEHSTAHATCSPPACSGALKSPRKRATVSSKSDSMSSSDASTHWESCSEGDTTSASRVQRSRASRASTSVKLQTGTSMPSTISGHTIGQAPIASRVVERTRTSYALSGFSISQEDQPAAPNLFERTSRAYAFAGHSVPRDFHFSATTQPEQANFMSTGFTPTYTQDNAPPRGSTRNNPARGPSSRISGVKGSPQLDPLTTRQVKKGKLVVEPTKGQASLSDKVLLDGPNIECNPS